MSFRRNFMRRANPMTGRNHPGPKHVSEISAPAQSTVLSKNKKEMKTTLASLLQNRIHIGGYLPLCEFMKQCLQDSDYGYYSTKKTVIGGASADFVTAPEMPIFCDVLCGWIVDTWSKLGTPRQLNLVELGPGRGTLMLNVLRQLKHVCPPLFEFVNIHMVEIGAQRQEEQKAALKDFQTASRKIQWYLDMDSVATEGVPLIVIANEFFDALPVSQFTKTERGWVETVLDVDEEETSEAHFKLAHAAANTFATYFVPEDLPKEMEQIEINTYGMTFLEKLGKKMIDSGRAAALIIDYGKDEHMMNTLRGIRGHKYVDPLLSPGDIDLSAWVSFKQLKWVLARWPLAQQQLQWFGPITQRSFLEQNGIDVRLLSMVKDQETKIGLNVIQHYRRLMEEKEMGNSYKVFCVTTRNMPPPSPWFK